MSSTGSSHHLRRMPGSLSILSAVNQATPARRSRVGINAGHSAGKAAVRKRKGLGEDLTDIAGGTRTPRAASPSEPVFPVVEESVVTDVMFDHAAREHDHASGAAHQMTHHEVFGEIALQMFQAAYGREVGAPRRDGAADGEIHAVQHALREHSGKKIRIEPERFEARPKARPADRAVRTCDQRSFREFGHRGFEAIGGQTDVAVGHEEVLMARMRQQRTKAPDLGVRLRRHSRYDEARGNLREIGHHAARNGCRRVGFFMNGEQDFEILVNLHEDAAQIGFRVVLRAGQRPHHGDRGILIEAPIDLGGGGQKIMKRRTHGQHAVNQRPDPKRHQGRDKNVSGQ